MGIPYTAAHGTIRFSFSRYNSMADVDQVLKVMPDIVAALRNLSPYWDGDKPLANPEQAFAPTYS
jgi:cysteine desulfurase